MPTRINRSLSSQAKKALLPEIKGYRNTVWTLLFRSTGEVALFRIFSPQNIGGWSLSKEHWQPPQGGVKPNELLWNACVREVLEEVGIRKKDIVFIAAGNDFPTYTTYFNGKNAVLENRATVAACILNPDADFNFREGTRNQEFDAFDWQLLSAVEDKAPINKHAIVLEITERFKPVVDALRDLYWDPKINDFRQLAEAVLRHPTMLKAFETGALRPHMPDAAPTELAAAL